MEPISRTDSRPAMIGLDGTQVDGIPVVSLGSIEKRLLDELTRMTGCTAPNASLARQPGVVHPLSQYRPGTLGP